MPPRPSRDSISSSGKRVPSSSGPGGASRGGAPAEVTTTSRWAGSDSRPSCIRHLGHSPPGEGAPERSAPQRGQVLGELSMAAGGAGDRAPFPEAGARPGYAAPHGSAPSRRAGAERLDQRSELFLHLGLPVDGLGDLAPQRRAEGSPQAVGGDLDRALALPEALAQAAERLAGLADERWLQAEEQLAPAAGRPVRFDALESALEHRQRPVALEGALGRELVGRLEPQALVRRLELQRERRAACPALLGLGAVPLVGEEVLQGAEQPGAEAPALRVRALDGVLLEQAREEGLRQVARVLAVVAAPAHISVERPPIRRAEVRERGARARFARTAGRQDDAPARGQEGGRTGRALSARLGRRHGAILAPREPATKPSRGARMPQGAPTRR